jgi:hypothetical protein
MAKQVGPFSTIQEAQAAADLVKRFGLGESVYYVSVVSQATSGRKATPKRDRRAKGIICPICGEALGSTRSVGPHSRGRKHKKAMAARQGAEQSAEIPSAAVGQ